MLWRQGQGPDVAPSYPDDSPGTRRCDFVGSDSRGQAPYRLDAHRAGPERLETGPFDLTIQDVAISPDGCYVLFPSGRDGRPPGDPSPPSLDPVGRELATVTGWFNGDIAALARRKAWDRRGAADSHPCESGRHAQGLRHRPTLLPDRIPGPSPTGVLGTGFAGMTGTR